MADKVRQKDQPEDNIFDEIEDYAYVNYTRVIGNNWDVRFAFGERKLKTLQPKGGVVMSHPHFKAFVEAMKAQLATLEATFGTIELETARATDRDR